MRRFGKNVERQHKCFTSTTLPQKSKIVERCRAAGHFRDVIFDLGEMVVLVAGRNFDFGAVRHVSFEAAPQTELEGEREGLVCSVVLGQTFTFEKGRTGGDPIAAQQKTFAAAAAPAVVVVVVEVIVVVVVVVAAVVAGCAVVPTTFSHDVRGDLIRFCKSIYVRYSMMMLMILIVLYQIFKVTVVVKMITIRKSIR